MKSVKAFVLLFVSIFTIQAYGASKYAIVFGKDGATGKIFPAANSLKVAKKIAKNTGSIELESESVLLDIDNNGFSLLFSGDQSKVLNTIEVGSQIKIAFMTLDVGDIQFAGAAAKVLYNALKVTPTKKTKKIQAKSLENIDCQVDAPLQIYSCVLRNVGFAELAE